MRILSLIHQPDAPTGVFADAIAAAGAELEEASLALGRPPSGALDSYDALIVMGGGAQVDQEDRLPWLVEEKRLIATALERRMPLLGACLGSQLVAEAAGADVGPLAAGPEIGWHEVELTPAASTDPLLSRLPPVFRAFEWHSYGFAQPPRGALLARSAAGPQAYRVADRPAWGIQFHAELRRETLASWLESYSRDEDARAAGVDRDELAAESAREIARWNELGRELAAAFVEAAR